MNATLFAHGELAEAATALHPTKKAVTNLHARVSSACTSLARAGRIFTIFSRERVGFLRFEWLQIGQDAL